MVAVLLGILMIVPGILLGIWFVIMGIFEIIGALMLRHELRAAVLSLKGHVQVRPVA